MAYAKKYPNKVRNITDGILEGRLAFCPVVSSQEEAARIENKLRRLFAEKRCKGHFTTFLDPAISSKSRNLNFDDMPTLDALSDTWGRASISGIGRGGKADATRVSLSYSL